MIGAGDGVATLFELTKTYADAGGATVRRIEKPVEGSVVIAVDGAPLDTGDYTVDAAAGLLTIAPGAAPAPGRRLPQATSSTFRFGLTSTGSTSRWRPFKVGSVPTVPLVEIKP
jgi:uncharacterized protein (TIGR02217 family)